MAEQQPGPADELPQCPVAADYQFPQSAQPLEIEDFLSEADGHAGPGAAGNPEEIEHHQQSCSLRGAPGPGLPEALGWTFGVFIAHLMVGLGLLITIGLVMFATGELKSTAPDLQEFAPAYMLLLVGGDQMFVLLASLVAASLRFSGRLGSTLNLSLPHPLHLFIVVGLTLPLSSLSSEIYRVVDLGWAKFVERLPALELFDSMNTVEALGELSTLAPLPVMLLIIAVGPALGEELIFRGVIGRGLVARWGLVSGVAISSFLFAIMHLHPVHVIAVLPIGIALHLIYLATRSFWAPVLLHFLNNSWATTASRMGQSGDLAPEVIEASPSAGLLIASVVAVIVLGALLYRTRTRYLLPDGVEWTPGYLSTESPPAELNTRQDHGLWSLRSLATAATAWVSFAVAFAAEIAAYAAR